MKLVSYWAFFGDQKSDGALIEPQYTPDKTQYPPFGERKLRTAYCLFTHQTKPDQYAQICPGQQHQYPIPAPSP